MAALIGLSSYLYRLRSTVWGVERENKMSDEWSPPEAELQTGDKQYGKYTYKPLGIDEGFGGAATLGVVLLVMSSVIEVIDTFGDYGLSRLVEMKFTVEYIAHVDVFLCGAWLSGSKSRDHSSVVYLALSRGGQSMFYTGAKCCTGQTLGVLVVHSLRQLGATLQGHEGVMRLADEDLNAAAMFDTGLQKSCLPCPFGGSFGSRKLLQQLQFSL